MTLRARQGHRYGDMIQRTLRTMALVLLLPGVVTAERLPVRVFTTADGLAHNVVNRIVRDSRGFLWFCTREGLSRFDGTSFVTYGVDHGLPSANVNDLLETRDGTYWIATSRGLARFEPMGVAETAADRRVPQMFVPGVEDRTASADVTALLEDPAGQVWVGTLGGLFRLKRAPGDRPRLERFDLDASPEILSLAYHQSGELWVGTNTGLRLLINGVQRECYTTRHGLPGNFVATVLSDRDGRIWAGTRDGGLALLTREPRTGTVAVQQTFTTGSGLSASWVNGLLQTYDGVVWVATSAGVDRLVPDGSGSATQFRGDAVRLGLGSGTLSLAEDRTHHLWAGTSKGAARVISGGFTIFIEEDGVPAASSLVETPRGELVAMTAGATRAGAVRFVDGRFVPLRLPIGTGGTSWGWNQMMLVDGEGDWWIGTRSGVLRLQGVGTAADLPHARLRVRYSTADGLASNIVIRLFEDSRGDVWIATVGEGYRNGVSRWERSTGKLLHHGADADGWPSLDRHFVTAFAEDRSGDVWIGFSGDAGLGRYRAGRFAKLTLDGGQVGTVRDFVMSSDGSVWAASTRGGLLHIVGSSTDAPAVSSITTAHGLSSNDVGAIIEDRSGRIYAATTRAIDRVDPRSTRIRQLRTGEGLPVGDVYAAIRDRSGALWFGSNGGVIRFVPPDDPPAPPPGILIDTLMVNARSHKVSALGQTELERFTVPPGRAAIQVGYIAPGLGVGDRVRYQLMLQGMDRAWSEPFEQRSVSYANVGPGRYRFMVRAVSSDGIVSAHVAGFDFEVLAPLWQRWWFASGVLAAFLAGGYTVSRYRLSRVLQIAEMRARIATDLHDDIGANLTRIAVLTEVVRRQRTAADLADTRLASIASVARESMSAMSDIVWAIAPERDRAGELAQRMRDYAEEVFAASEVALVFAVPASLSEVRLGIDVRRDLYLVFKEAANNAARHSRCTRFQVDLRLSEGLLHLVVADNGTGFDATAPGEGNGLTSMRRRAARLAGRLTVASDSAGGTTVHLRLPFVRRRGRPARTGR